MSENKALFNPSAFLKSGTSTIFNSLSFNRGNTSCSKLRILRLAGIDLRNLKKLNFIIG